MIYVKRKKYFVSLKFSVTRRSDSSNKNVICILTYYNTDLSALLNSPLFSKKYA